MFAGRRPSIALNTSTSTSAADNHDPTKFGGRMTHQSWWVHSEWTTVMSRPTLRAHPLGGVLTFAAVALTLLLAFASSANAQYGGVSGLFVTISPTSPNIADFTGLGCAGGDEVVLYLPTVTPTASDPSSVQSVPGRVLAVTTARSSNNELEDGTFAFPGVVLPADLDPGTYAVHARCGDLDLRVIIEISADGAISVEPDTDPDTGPATENQIPEALPFTGRNANRVVSFAAGLVAVGVSLGAYGRRAAGRSAR